MHPTGHAARQSLTPPLRWTVGVILRVLPAVRLPVASARLLLLSASLATALTAIGLTSVTEAEATAGSDLLPLTNSDIRVFSTWGQGYHSYPALDLEAPHGRPVYASGAGTVARARGGCPPYQRSDQCNGGAGNYVAVGHGSHYSRYMHLSSMVVGQGQTVAAGQLLGYTGRSGWTTFAHLHYEESSSPDGGTRYDPGTLYACHGASRVAYPAAAGAGSWQALSNSRFPLRNDGYGCSAGPAPGSPTGNLDHASGAAGGLIQVNGWTLDPDDRGAVGEVHVYVDGPAGQGRYIGNLRAGNVRRDVAAAHGANPARGFSGALGGVPAGNHRIFVYALNAAGGGDNVVISSPTVNVPDLPAGSTVGSFDDATGHVGGKAAVRGWAVDPDVPTEPLEIHAYVDGPAGAAAKGVNLGRPSVAREDIPRAVPGAGPNQGFSADIDGLEPGRHTIWIYAINRAGGGIHRMIGTRNVEVPGPSPLANVEHISSAGGGFLQLNGWALDPDVPERPTAIHVYIDGNRFVGSLDAANSRPDIPNAFPGASREHGFSGALGGIPPARHRVDVYAIDINGTENVRIRSEELDFSALPPGSPVGSFDSAMTEPGGARLTGWAFDPDSPRAGLEMHAYIDGPPGAALKGINLGRAETTRNDVGAAHPDAGEQHGLDRLVEGLPDGRHTIWLYAINAESGGHSPLLGTKTVVTGPDAPGTTIDSGPSSTIDESSATFGFSSSRAGSTFECKIDEQAFETCTSPKSFSSLAEGSHRVSVRAIDPEGDKDPSPATRTFAVDTDPNTMIISGPSGQTRASSPSFRFSADQPGSTFRCRLDNGRSGACRSPKSYGDLSNGKHTFQVRAIDASGNEDPTVATRTFTVDTVIPVIKNLALDPTPFDISRDRRLDIDFGVDEPGGGYRVNVRIQHLATGDIVRSLGTRSKPRSGSVSFSWDGRNDDGRRVARGRYAVYVTVSDTAGNRRAKRKGFDLTR